MIKIQKGLDLPITGKPEQQISDTKLSNEVAVIGFDYNGMKPTMAVKVGDKVKRGQLLFEDKKTEGVKYTAPAAGTIKEVNRGERRVFQSVVISVEGDDAVEFDKYAESDLGNLSREQVVKNLVDSGLWVALKTRPYSRVPAVDSVPHSIFISAMDTNPLAADPEVIIKESIQDFNNGLQILKKLTEGKVFVGVKGNASIGVATDSVVEQKSFDGPHPAGNVGTHIHFVSPVSVEKTVWTLGYQDVIAFGRLFTSGELNVDRVVALAGPVINKPRLVRTRLGANLTQLCEGEVATDVKPRIISGSVFGGRSARGPVAYLGRYSNQVSVLEEGDKRELFGWLTPGTNKFSKLNIYLSSLAKGKLFNFTTTTNGSERAMVPVGTYEEVMPLDILPTQLLRALLCGDTDMAQKLGCLELEEEDLALCTFVCPGKYEYGPVLRDNLTRIEKEG